MLEEVKLLPTGAAEMPVFLEAIATFLGAADGIAA